MGLLPILVYLALCILVSFKGVDTRLGFLGTMLLSVIFTPLIVFIALILFEGRIRRSA
jgi:hypothetical protein